MANLLFLGNISPIRKRAVFSFAVRVKWDPLGGIDYCCLVDSGGMMRWTVEIVLVWDPLSRVWVGLFCFCFLSTLFGTVVFIFFVFLGCK